MNTETYEKLLSELGIPSEWSAENKESVLDEKYSEALELLDVAQQNGEEDRIAQLDDRIKNIEEALEYTKEMKKRLSSGLVLNTQSDKDRLDELKEAGKKEETQTVKQLETTSQTAVNTPIPQPSVPSNNANPLLQSQMRRAKMELEDENWRMAAQLYNDILNAEPENTEANLGLFMANQHIRKKNDIPEAARDAKKDNRDIFQDKQYQRALRYADDSLKKELESYEKGGDYLIAIEEYQRAKTIEDYQKVSEMFDKLGDFADAGKQKKECDGHWQKPLYDSTMRQMKNAGNVVEFTAVVNNFDKLGDYGDAREQRKLATYLLAVCFMQYAKDISDFSVAKKMFEELGDYSHSKDKIKECEAGIKRLQEQREAYDKYQQEYAKFEKQVVELQEIKQHESRIADQQGRIDSLERRVKKNSSQLRKRWILLIELGLFCCFMLVLKRWHLSLLDDFINAWIELIALFIDGASCLNIYIDGVVSDKLAIIVLILYVFPFVYLFCHWVRYHMEEDYDGPMFASFKSFWKAGFISAIINASMIWIGYIICYSDQEKLCGVVGVVGLIIAVAFMVKRIMGKMMVKLGTEEIKRLKWSIEADYENIRKIVGMEYQKIYDRYPAAGSKRKAVSEVQSLLMDTIKKRHGAG